MMRMWEALSPRVVVVVVVGRFRNPCLSPSLSLSLLFSVAAAEGSTVA
jgi:hypothetical protein